MTDYVSPVQTDSPESPPMADQRLGLNDIQLKTMMVELASRVYDSLGPGYRELAYQKAMEVELTHENIPFLSQAAVPIYYRDTLVAWGIADLVVDNRLVVELKASSTDITLQNINQCTGYMRTLHIPQGIVLNFAQYANNQQIGAYDCYLGTSIAVKQSRDIIARLFGPNGDDGDDDDVVENGCGPRAKRLRIIAPHIPLEQQHPPHVDKDDGMVLQGLAFSGSVMGGCNPSFQFQVQRNEK